MPSLPRYTNKRRHHTAPANLSRHAMNRHGMQHSKNYHTKARAANAMIAKIKAKNLETMRRVTNKLAALRSY